MRLQLWKSWKKTISFSLYLKCGAIFFFLMLTVLIVACGGTSNSSPADLGNPVVTVTIRIGDGNASPTPPLPAYSCGAWATDTSPASAAGSVNVYAKFVHNLNGNPEGVGDAGATATVNWPDGSTDTKSATTTSDGLAVFSIPLKPVAINKIVLIQVTFSKAGVPPCSIPQAAYFTIVISSPTAGSKASPSATGTTTATPTATTTPGGTPSPSPTTFPSPSPTPTKTPKPTPTRPPH
jgi:hypothetical protein